MLLDVKVTTKASQSTVIGWNNGYLLVRLKAVPEKGKANAALTELLGDYFSLPKSQVEIVSGTTSRVKRIRLHTYTIEQIIL